MVRRIAGAIIVVGAFVACASSGSTGDNWRNCNGTDDPRTCGRTQMYPFDSAPGCFEEKVLVPDFCLVCTIEFASASIGPVCGVDPDSRLHVFTTRPDLRLEAPGWRFGRRRDRGIYTQLEPESLTAEEREACERAAVLWFDAGFEGHRCGDVKDAGGDGG